MAKKEDLLQGTLDMLVLRVLSLTVMATKMPFVGRG